MANRRMDIKDMITGRCLAYADSVFIARNQAIKFSESDLLERVGIFMRGDEKPFEMYKNGKRLLPKTDKGVQSGQG